MNEPRRTIVKVCGITRVEDARIALESGADWLGVILSGDTPRRIDVERARAIASAVDGAVIVAVLVSPTPDESLRLAERAGAARVQLHRVNPLDWPADFPLPIAVCVPVADDGAMTTALPPARHLPLLDTAHATLTGGTGRSFPWETARVVAATRPLLLAGGLGPHNVADALTQVRPFGVDACSRLESSPGIKDATQVRKFVAAVRACDEGLDAR
jgi:phosphoribosylanthranilate isomerase